MLTPTSAVPCICGMLTSAWAALDQEAHGLTGTDVPSARHNYHYWDRLHGVGTCHKESCCESALSFPSPPFLLPLSPRYPTTLTITCPTLSPVRPFPTSSVITPLTVIPPFSKLPVRVRTG